MDKWQENDHRRQKVIGKAVDAANRIIGEGSDGSVEETNFLTAEVARKLMEVALIPFSNNLRDYDISKGNEPDD